MKELWAFIAGASLAVAAFGLVLSLIALAVRNGPDWKTAAIGGWVALASLLLSVLARATARALRAE